MGSCCNRCCARKDGDEHEKFTSGGPKDLSQGPATERRQTDIIWIVIFAVHWLIFLIVTFVGAPHGDPRKLYLPRDFHGGYCGIGSYADHKKLVQTMNVTEMTDPVATQLVCSSTASSSLSTVLSNMDYDAYLCACCLVPCKRCEGSLGVPDVSNPTDMVALMSTSMSRLTDPTQGATLFSSASSAYSSFSADAVFREVTKYFIPVCHINSCSMDVPTTTNATSNTSTVRRYVYSPDPDSLFRKAWTALATSPSVPAGIRSSIARDFTFQALPYNDCPYDPKYCVPMPGVNFQEAPDNYCLPRLDSAVSSALGGAAVSVLEGLGTSGIAQQAAEGIGGLAGQVMASLDALFITAFWSFLLGIFFVVIVRFLIGCFVWTSLCLVLFFLVAGGCVAFFRSEQCRGASLLSTGTQSVVAIAEAATNAAENVVLNSHVQCNEGTTGYGADYRGCQTRTRSGRLCQRWEAQSPHNHTYTPENYPNASLWSNYCRNPTNGSSIWCVTVDDDKVWEECSPIGIISAACPLGYAMPTQTSRDALRICAYIVWILAGVWIILVICLYSRIRLAIAINKVAAMFIYHTPTVLLVPVIQIIIAVAYFILWAMSACFLLSQVPAKYTSSASGTWDEAMGTSTTPGFCNSRWPAGFAWKDAGDLTSRSDPCSGDMGNVTGITPRCWRCAAPRYVLDYAFAYSFFSYLWNNAFFIALSQCILAGTVGAWFFTKRALKGKESPLLKAVITTLHYHIGSLAFGSFIVAVVQFIRYVLMYLQKQAEMHKNKVMVLVLKVLVCCMWCFEKCLKFLNKNAYIQIALLGKGFCESAKNAFFLIMRNFLRFGTILVLGSVVTVIGTTVISVGTAIVGYFVLQLLHPNAAPVFPVLCYLAIGYVVAKLFMSVFSMTVDTSLQCFIATEEQGLDADFVPQPLRNFVATGGKGTVTKVAPN